MSPSGPGRYRPGFLRTFAQAFVHAFPQFALPGSAVATSPRVRHVFVSPLTLSDEELRKGPTNYEVIRVRGTRRGVQRGV